MEVKATASAQAIIGDFNWAAVAQFEPA